MERCNGLVPPRRMRTTQCDSVPPHIYSFHTHLKDNYPDNFFMQPTDIYEIKSVVQKLKTKCSEGFDSSSTKLIQQTIEEIAIPLEHTINQPFDCCNR